MTTTAKQSSSSTDVRGSSPASSNFEAAEDIESIAKQISDHAEAIYQEWKARGLAPTEILKCHPDTDNNFNRTLSPKSSPTTPTSRTILDHHTQPISPELLAKAPDLSNSNLEHLVNSFVNEDKARIAAQRSDSPSGSSSIKYTLKKFENLSERSPSPVTSPPSYSSNAKSYSSPQQQDIINKTNSTLTNNNNNLNYRNKNELEQEELSHHHHHVPDVLKDTIEKSSKRPKPETPVKPEHLLNHVPTWPLKHRPIAQNKSDMKTPVDKNKVSGPSSSTLGDKSPSIDVLDEVSREEEKLINALKTGTVLTNECLPVVIKPSLNEYKTQAEQQLNGISTVIKENNNRNENDINSVTQSQPTPPPQKPNHTPIYVPHKEESKGFSSFARVSTTRIPSRHDPKSDDKKFELKSVPSPVRPFLSRGSVAERVLIFEKCPEKTPMRTTTEKPKIQVS